MRTASLTLVLKDTIRDGGGVALFTAYTHLTLLDHHHIHRGRANVRVLTEMSLFFLSQIITFNVSSSLNKKFNRFMY